MLQEAVKSPHLVNTPVFKAVTKSDSFCFEETRTRAKVSCLDYCFYSLIFFLCCCPWQIKIQKATIVQPLTIRPQFSTEYLRRWNNIWERHEAVVQKRNRVDILRQLSKQVRQTKQLTNRPRNGNINTNRWNCFQWRRLIMGLEKTREGWYKLF